ncbi:MAG: foldase [Firmicutes bacterium]|nr:foldase [Bacillota bacterium]
MKFQKIFTVLILLIVLCTPTVLAADEEIVASVNGKQITLAEYYQRLEQEAGAIILNQMIIEELLLQKQIETNIEVTEDDLSMALIEIITQVGGFEGLQYYLYQTGMSEDEFLAQLELNILISKLAENEVQVTDEEIEAWFYENKNLFAFEEEVEASHILVDTEAEALEIMELLNSGADFAELARTRSQDTYSAINDGQLGYFSKGTMVEPFEQMAFSLDINELGMVESTFGWHIIKVTDKQEAREATLEEAWEQAKRSLIAAKTLDPYAYIDKLRQEAEIEIYR